MNRKDLVEALDRVAPGLSPKESIEQSDCYVLLGDKIVTFNDEIAVSYPFDIGIEGAVNATTLYKLLKRIKTKEIDVSVKGGELRIKGGKGKGGIRLDSEIALPIEDFKGEKEWIPCPHGFAQALRMTLYTVSREENMGVCTGVHVSETFAESTDNFRVTRKFYDELDMPFDDFVIPAVSAKHIMGYDLDEVYVDGTWAHFRAKDDTEISCRIYNEEYPNLQRFAEAEGGTTVELPDSFADLVSRAGVFSEMDEEVALEKIKLTLQKNKLIVRGDAEQGHWEEEAKVEYDDDKIEFFSSPQHLVEMFALTREFTISDTLITFKKADDFVYVTAMISDD